MMDYAWMPLVYFSILGIVSWSSVSESSNIRGFKNIEMKLPKLFNMDFTVKMSNVYDIALPKQIDKGWPFRCSLKYEQIRQLMH